MSSNPIFISCMTPATSDGDLLFTLTTFNASTNIALTMSVTGLLSSDTEEDIATSINEQFTSQLIPYAYNGQALFSDQSFVAQFRMSQTEHVASIWSQCGYELKLISNDTGSIIKVNTNPILMTVSEAQEQAAVQGFQFTAPDGSPFTDNQISDILLKASVQVTAFLRCKVAITTYLNTWRGKDNKSVFTTPTPGIKRDSLMVRRKAYINLYTNPTYLTYALFWDRETGELNYRPTSEVVNTKGPFDLDNEVQMTITAGYYQIPSEVLWVLTSLAELNMLGIQSVKTLKGGSGSIEFREPGELYNRIFATIKHLKSS